MIYPCPYCDTELNLQPEHIGRRITCPACNRSFIADDLPPVTIAEKPAENKRFKLIIRLLILMGLLAVMFFLLLNINWQSYRDRHDLKTKGTTNATKTLRELDKDASDIGD